ncbi:MAG: RluA family pseudouridine synthase [Marinagarivorans sp.]|nr:RluA family pseudouridine synthase [Marinagarivorans sp.]
MIRIIFEDEHLLVLNKPPGILSVPGKTEPDCLQARAMIYNPNCRAIHRLDMATSGLLIFAKNHAALRAMSTAFETRKVSKTYHTIVQGLPAQDQGLIDQPLRCDWPNRPKQMICYEHGRTSQTRYSVITRHHAKAAALMYLYPITGRSHQLRVHCEHLGHPILGDQLYGNEASRAAAPRLLLHAAELSFEHPVSQKTMALSCPSGFENFAEEAT